MTIRNWAEVGYLPMLSLRPAEMRALEELPNRTKDILLPTVHLRPWVGAHRLENALGRIADAYGERPIIIAMGEIEPPNSRPVHAQLAALRDPANGFHEWCEFMEEQAHQHFIPAIQYSIDQAQEEAQITRLQELGRGLIAVIERPQFPAIGVIAQRVGERTNGGEGVCFILDFGLATPDHLQVAALATGYFESIREHAPNAFVSLSASSFPDSFGGIDEQPIYERRLFESLPPIANLIYSDRGSARVERQMGGGGQPYPRIDYPLSDQWNFYRSDEPDGFDGYCQQAVDLIATEPQGVWNPNLRVWGTQMIERTAAGDTAAISSPARATAARINLHLQRQTFFDNPQAAEDTDEDWDI